MTANVAYDRDAFYRAILRGLGFDETLWRMEFLWTWAKYENTGAGYNPLATTRVSANVVIHSNWNDNGGNPVKNYASFADGVTATLETLRLSYYTLVIESLRQQRILAGTGDQLRTWGTMGFAEQADSQAIRVYQPTRLNAPPVPHVVTLGYLATWGTYYTPERPHLGIDFGCPVGTPVRSPYLNPVRVRAVHRVDASNTPLDGWGNGTLGNIAVLDIEDTRFFGGFAHLSRIDVQADQVISTGQVIGLSGASGFVDGAHLHLQHTVHDSFSRDAETENPLSGLVTTPSNPPPHTGPWVPTEAELHAMLLSLNSAVISTRDEILARLARIEGLPPGDAGIGSRLDGIDAANARILAALAALGNAFK